MTYWLGIVFGTLIVLLAVAAGITAAVLAIPHVRTVLIVVSAAYLLRLAYKIATAPPPGERPPTRVRPRSLPERCSASRTRRHGSRSPPSTRAATSPARRARTPWRSSAC